MDTSTHILVIVLSVMLAIFLLLVIAIAVQLVRLLRAISRIVQKAEQLVDTAENVGHMFEHAGGSLSAFRLLHNIVELVTRHNKRGK